MNNFTVSNYGFMVTVKESSTFESKSTTFDVREVRSISRDWSDVTVRFNDGSRKTFDAFPMSKGQQLEQDLERAIRYTQNSSPYYRPPVVVEEHHYHTPHHHHSDNTDAATALGALAGVAIALGIDAYSNRNRTPVCSDPIKGRKLRALR
jgi:hypothetical protein